MAGRRSKTSSSPDRDTLTQLASKTKTVVEVTEPTADETKLKIIEAVVGIYVDKSVYEIGCLRKEVELEQQKNDRVKPLLQECASRLLELEPDSAIAQEALTLLLETKMKGEETSSACRPKRRS